MQNVVISPFPLPPEKTCGGQMIFLRPQLLGKLGSLCPIIKMERERRVSDGVEEEREEKGIAVRGEIVKKLFAGQVRIPIRDE